MLSKVITSEDAPKAIGPYSQGIKLVTSSIYWSESHCKDNELVNGDIERTTRNWVWVPLLLSGGINLELKAYRQDHG